MAKTKKLPKKIAGYKVPKLIRKNSQPILALLGHKRFQTLIGAAIAAGLAAMAEADDREQAIRKSKPTSGKGKGAVEDAGDDVTTLAREGVHRATDIAEALGRAVASAISSHLPGHTVKAAPTQH